MNGGPVSYTHLDVYKRHVLYLPVRFVSSAGINVVDNIGELADLVLSHFAQ